VACKVFGTGLLSKEECDVDTSITTVEVDHIGLYHGSDTNIAKMFLDVKGNINCK
jgi:hypothetical protein